VKTRVSSGADVVHCITTDLESARRLLGSDKIIGVTVSDADETRAACEGGADYLGIGTVFATPT
jgi:thiamine-phosphate diphosphorylase/hydroxyethylthiazole kinase